jgi:uncharacterized membrane protein
MLAVGINSGIYKLLLVLHILTVIVGIGAVMLNGLYAAQSQKRPGAPGRAVSEANFAVSQIAEKVIYLIPIFGILLVLVSDDAWDFGQTWIWLSLLIYIAAIGVAHGVLTPGHRKINSLLAEMEASPPPAGGAPPQVAQIQALGQRQAMAGMFNNLAVVVLVALMIWKPGA